MNMDIVTLDSDSPLLDSDYALPEDPAGAVEALKTDFDFIMENAIVELYPVVDIAENVWGFATTREEAARVAKTTKATVKSGCYFIAIPDSGGDFTRVPAWRVR
jgi:hypothetical protein